MKGKLLNILCAVTYDCKAILTLLTKSLQYLMAVHILNLRALEETIRMIFYIKKTKRNTSLYSTRVLRTAVGRLDDLKP